MTDRATLALPLVDRIAARIPDAPPDARPGRAQLAAVVAQIAETFRPERIVLFGSRAYGTPGYDSDVDLMVVMETDLRNPEQAFRIHSTLDLRPSFALDILVRRPDQIALGLAEGDFFVEDVITKGITLYALDATLMSNKPNGADSAGTGGPGATGKRQPSASITVATQGWLDKGASDLRSAKRLGEPPDPMFDTACFHAQQSAEKDLKAFLQQRAIRFPRTHELATLADLVVQALPDLAALRPDLVWLSDYAVDIRYPGVAATQLDYDRAVRIAAQVKTLVRTALHLTP